MENRQLLLADGKPQEKTIVNESMKNITICKNVYKNLYGSVADCLCQAFNYMDKEQLKEINKDLQQSYFFIDFDYKHDAADQLRPYAHFFNKLERFPGSLEFAVVPQGDIPSFINTSDIILPRDLYDRFKASDAGELVSVQMLASLHMHLGSSLTLSQKIMA